MKKYLVLFTFLFLLGSCKWDDKVEDNPLVTLSSLTPISQLNFFSFAYGEVALYNGILMQHVSASSDFMQEIETYNLLPEYFDNSWSVCYLGVLSNLNTIINVASDNRYGKYRGIAKIMMANTLGIATDIWGDIPFSESFFSESISFSPKYDSQEYIYSEILRLLNEGIQDITDYPNNFHPSDDDIIFEGNSQSWIKFANFLKLRYAFHLSKLYGFEDISSLIDESIMLIEGESFSIDYSKINFSSPLNIVLNQHPNQVRASEFIIDYLKLYDDPRLGVYFLKNSDGVYLGSSPGEHNENASALSEIIKGPSSRLTVGSYTEQMFILSEYFFKTDMEVQSRQAFNEAVRSSLLDYNISNEVWLSGYLNEVDFSLETIIIAKSIALFLQTEIWSDWRRTGYPQLSPPFNNTTGGIIPRRFSYPQSEFLYNPNNVPSDITITDRVWWDI